MSSKLGDGLWDSGEGKKFKTYLNTKFPEFYKNFPSLEMSADIEEVDASEVAEEKYEYVNNWLIKKANLNHYSDSKKMLPITIQDLFSMMKNFKSEQNNKNSDVIPKKSINTQHVINLYRTPLEKDKKDGWGIISDSKNPTEILGMGTSGGDTSP